MKTTHHYQAKARQFNSKVKELHELIQKNETASGTFRKLLSRARHLAMQLERVFGSAFIKRAIAGTAVAAALLLNGNLQAQNFSARQINPFNIDPVNMSENSSIRFADIDGDGDLDLLNFYQYSDYYYPANSYIDLVLHRNTGTPANPSFGPAEINSLGGFNRFTRDFGQPYAFFDVADIDGDGDLDILVALYEETGLYISESNIYLFRNTGSATNPNYTTAPVKNPYGISLPNDVWAVTPNFADFDNDGDLDLLVTGLDYTGNYESKILYLQNTGSTQNPVYGAPQNNPFGLSFADYAFYTAAVGDLDKDSDLDILVHKYAEGSTSYESVSSLLFFRNNGTASAPGFGTPQINPYNLQAEGVSTTKIGICPALTDIDNDGDLDVFVWVYDYVNENFIAFQRNEGVSSAVKILSLDIELRTYPNPVMEDFTVSYSLQEPVTLSIELSDLSGKLQTILYHGIQKPGKHQLEFALPENLPQGTYMLSVKTDEGIAVKKFVRM